MPCREATSHSVNALTEDSPRIIQAIQKASIGSLGPSGSRNHLRYYDSVFYASVQFGADAKSGIEVGCASDPFIKHLNWLDQRTCLAPYFVDYDNKTTTTNMSSMTVEMITSDFMEYELPENKPFDLLLCSQVLEHVPTPELFMKKLISSARTSIISVPLEWRECGPRCGHKTHNITYKQLLEWSAPHVPISSLVVAEDRGAKMRRIILVYRRPKSDH